MTIVVDRPTFPVIETSAPAAAARLAASLPSRSAEARHREDRDRPACADAPQLFLDPALEAEPVASAPARARHRYAALAAETTEICAGCPVLTACLYRAVVDYDVAGFVAGTTPRQRGAIRARLGIEVEAEDFDSLAGVVGVQRSVDHDEVVRLRRTHPEESLERIARRLGCSLSTVKRHLRRERNEPAPLTGGSGVRPTRAAVLRATAEILSENSGSRRAAA
jgi:hypothetical protein